jgi:Entner-Doudoroff aldolase
MMQLADALAACPTIAILRGVRPSEVVEIGAALFDAGIRVVEVPLNSPEPFTSIRLLQETFGGRMVVGAGTVTSVSELHALMATGARLVVSPHTDAALINEAQRLNLMPVPGFQTASEAFIALAAGARWLKLFPSAAREEDIRAMSAVLPKDVRVIAVGGVGPHNFLTLRRAGASAFGVGRELFKPGDTVAEVASNARRVVSAACEPTVLAQAQTQIGESPKWSPRDTRVRWVDPLQSDLLSCALDGGSFRRTKLPRPVWSIGQNGEGATDSGFCTIDGENFFEGPPAPQQLGCRLNDMAIDMEGGFWGGSIHRGLLAGRGALFYAPNIHETPRAVATDLGVPNGMSFSRNGSTLYLVDTLFRTLLAYPVEGSGRIGEPRVLSDFLGQPGKPDGMCVGVDGTLWVALWGGAAVLQLSPDGVPIRRVAVPTSHVSSCCFVPDGRLLVSTSTMRLSPAQLAAEPLAGSLFALEVS